MKTFRNLYIHLNGVDVDTLSGDLDNQSQPTWTRRKDKEEELGDKKRRPLCFEAKKGASVPPSVLYIFQKERETLWVSNIVPTENSELTCDQYNLALVHFYENIVRPAIEGTPITAELTSDQVSIGSIAGEEAEKAIFLFSDLANKSTGSSHPLDRKRWLEFLVLAHEARSGLDSGIIIRTLVELGWPEEKAVELGIEFEFAEDLLSYIEER
jgi:hypothetical protein